MFQIRELTHVPGTDKQRPHCARGVVGHVPTDELTLA